MHGAYSIKLLLFLFIKVSKFWIRSNTKFVV
jgi:hypothetical protein